MHLHPYDVDPGNYELWDKVGQGVGNLKSLSVLKIILYNNFGNGEDEPACDWEILARILPHIQNKIDLWIETHTEHVISGREDMLAFARAIQGHSAITRLNCYRNFSHETLDTLSATAPIRCRSNELLSTSSSCFLLLHVFCLGNASESRSCLYILLSIPGQRRRTTFPAPREHNRFIAGTFFAIRGN
jgi:hypothetical protein